MQALLAIAGLTWKAALRFRLIRVLAVLLLGSVIVLPILLKDDGTAHGFIQIMLTYTLSVISTLLGLSTLWLACGTLARDIEEGQMQMVAVKPVSRWQIWLGKWIGILLINGALLALSGASVFVLLQWRARQLPPREQAVLKNEIFVARASLREPRPNFEGELERQLQLVPDFRSYSPEQQQQVRVQMREGIKAKYQVVPPNHQRVWNIELGVRHHLLKGQPLFVRAKFHAAQTNLNGTYLGLWWFGPREQPKARRVDPSLATDTFHEIVVPPDMFDENGRLTIVFENRNDSALIFPLEDDLEVLYREGGFGLNYVRGLAIILCWLALLAALGLAAASLLSFPVAAFFSLSVLIVAMSSGTLASVVQEGSISGADHETGAVSTSWADFVLIPFFRGILSVVDLVQNFSPVDALSTGRSITWGQLGQAFGQVVLLLGGLLGVVGVICFIRRELAAAQGTQ